MIRNDRREGRFPAIRSAAFAALTLCSLLVAPGYAQTTGASVVFLMIEPDSRAAGMGNTGVALADNAYALFWNPAGLAYQQGSELSITHSNWLPEFDAGLYHESLVAKHTVGGIGTFGGHITFLNLGEQTRLDEDGNEMGNFRSYDLAAGLSYARNATGRFALGVGARLIYSDLVPATDALETTPGVSAGLDLAGLYRSRPFSLGGVPTTASAGFNLANMGPKIKYTEESDGDPIPTNLRFGYAFTFDFDEYNSLTLANDFTKMLTHKECTTAEGGEKTCEIDPWHQAIFSSWQPIQVDRGTPDSEDLEELSVPEQLLIGAGLEYWYNRQFAARAGYFYENPYNGNRQFLTFGAGIRYSMVGVDVSYIYALEENRPLANTMRFSLLLNFAR